MNSRERDGGGGRGVGPGGEVDQDGKTESEQNVSEMRDQNGKEISVTVQDETSGLGEKVEGDHVKEEENKVDKVKEEEDKVDKVKEEVDNVKEREEDGVEALSRLSERGKPWISTIYNTGSLCSSSLLLKWNM